MVLRVQVVRAEQEIWRQLAKTHMANARHANIAAAADSLRRAIERKQHRRDPGVVLALDADYAGSFAFKEVVRSFRERHGGWARALGFQAIWVVGPSEVLTVRLDVDEGMSAA